VHMYLGLIRELQAGSEHDVTFAEKIICLANKVNQSGGTKVNNIP